jgi:hypothetical protein
MDHKSLPFQTVPTKFLLDNIIEVNNELSFEKGREYLNYKQEKEGYASDLKL